MVALVNGTPRTLSLREMLSMFIEFRSSVIRKRARFELGKDLKKKQSSVPFSFFFEWRKKNSPSLSLLFRFRSPIHSQQVRQRPGSTLCEVY